MTVEFTPFDDDCFCFGAPNGHFFALLKVTAFAEILNFPPLTNDPIVACETQAKLLAEIMRTEVLSGFYGDKAMYIEFFESCGGFETH